MTYETICDAVERYRDKIQEAFDFLLVHPACGFREWEASKYLQAQYESLGYKVTAAGDIPGFYADFDTGRPGPKIALFSELDALPCPEHPYADKETGAAHACVHHAQGATLLGVASVLAEEGAGEGLCGSVRFVIVPAEELVELSFRNELKEQGIIQFFGGKQEFIRRGYLDDCDIGFMIHTSTSKNRFMMWPGCNGCILKTAEFKGKSAHAGGLPHKGINAMYASNLSFNAINALRETFIDDDHVRVHPITVNAGKAANIIPEKALIENQVRASTVERCADVNRRVNRAVAASAAAMGANVRIIDRPGYMPGKYDRTLIKYVREAVIPVVGEQNAIYLPNHWDSGCTDMADVSCIMPALHAFGSGVSGQPHENDYLVTDFDRACLDSAKAQLNVVSNLLSDDAAKAKDIIANFTPTFPSREAYVEYVSRFFADYDGVEYTDDGAKLKF